MTDKTVAIIDYGSGNLRSAAKAFERVVHEAALRVKVIVTDDPDLIANADHVVLPGVGAFGDCMRGLSALPGMIEALEKVVLQYGRPFLGICVGMQLLASVGREHGDCEGLGWVPGEVIALEPSDPGMKIPHMGWNTLALHDEGNGHPLMNGVTDGQHAYFVHSYHFKTEQAHHVLAYTDYGGEVAAVIGRDNIVGTQFHPEKSQKTGLQFIHNFLMWRP